MKIKKMLPNFFGKIKSLFNLSKSKLVFIQYLKLSYYLKENKFLEGEIGETVLEADVMNTKMQFLYRENEVYFFMHLSTYEQSEVNKSILNDNTKWLIDGDECDVTIWNDNVIQVDPPKFVNLTVKSTMDAIKGDTVSSTLKEAIMDNDEMIMVPIFIKEGELIRIDTENSEYTSRVKS